MRLTPAETTFIQESLSVRRRSQIQRAGLILAFLAIVLGALLVFALSENQAATAQSELRETAEWNADLANIESTRANAESTRAFEFAQTSEADAARAESAELLARARLLVTQGQNIYQENPLLGVQLVLEGYALAPDDTEVRSAVINISQPGHLAVLDRPVANVSLQSIIPMPNTDLFLMVWEARATEIHQTLDGALVETLPGIIKDVYFSPGGTYMIVSYTDLVPELRLTATGELIKAFADTEHDDRFSFIDVSSIQFLRFSSDENYVVLDYGSKIAELRRTTDGTRITGLTDTVEDVWFSPSSTYLVTAPNIRSQSWGGTLWQASHGALIETLDTRVNAVHFSPDETRFIMDPTSGSAEIRQSSDGRLIAELFGRLQPTIITEENRQTGVIFMNEGRWVLLDYADNSVPENFPGHTLPVEMRSLLDGAVIPSDLADQEATTIYSTFDESGVIAAQIELTRSIVTEAHLISLDNGAIIDSYNSQGMRIIHSLDGNQFVLAYDDRQAELRKTADGELIATLPGAVYREVTFSPDGQTFVVSLYGAGAFDTQLGAPSALHSALDGSIIKEFPLTYGKGLSLRVAPVEYSPDGSTILISFNAVEFDYGDSVPLYYDAATGIEIADIGRAPRFSPTGNYIVGLTRFVGENVGSPAAIYEAADGLHLRELAEFDTYTFSSNEAYFLAEFADDHSELLDLSTGVVLADLGSVLAGHFFDLAQQRLVVWYTDGRSYLIDLEWLQFLSQAQSLDDPILGIANQFCAEHWPLDDDFIADLAVYLGEREPQACDIFTDEDALLTVPTTAPLTPVPTSPFQFTPTPTPTNTSTPRPTASSTPFGFNPTVTPSTTPFTFPTVLPTVTPLSPASPTSSP